MLGNQTNEIMTDDLKKMRVDELELSLRSSELLQNLSVSTLGDLLELPEIATPDDWSPRSAKLVAADIRDALASLGVEYAGEIRHPEMRSASLVAEGTVRERWQTIETWLEAEHPGALGRFNPPASGETIAEAEATLGVELPHDYKEFLSIHNGQQDIAPFVGMSALLCIEDVAQRYVFSGERANGSLPILAHIKDLILGAVRLQVGRCDLDN